MLYLVTIIIAMSSILYELAFSQVLSSILGGTLLQYIMTIGFYVAFLGFGSLFYEKINYRFKNNLKLFLIIEFSIISISIISPFLILEISNIISGNLLMIISYIIISLIGFLSGLELPLLMDSYNDKINSYSGKILAYDFFGTFLGTILFPLILIPYINILYIPATISILNIFGVFIYLIRNKLR